LILSRLKVALLKLQVLF